MILKPYHEFVGDLIEVKIEDDKIKFLFSINTEIEVPQSVFDERELRDYIGNRVGVINVDGQVYKLRKISSINKKNRHG